MLPRATDEASACIAIEGGSGVTVDGIAMTGCTYGVGYASPNPAQVRN